MYVLGINLEDFFLALFKQFPLNLITNQFFLFKICVFLRISLKVNQKHFKQRVTCPLGANRQKKYFFQKLNIWSIIACKYFRLAPNSRKIISSNNSISHLPPCICLDFHDVIRTLCSADNVRIHKIFWRSKDMSLSYIVKTWDRISEHFSQSIVFLEL